MPTLSSHAYIVILGTLFSKKRQFRKKMLRHIVISRKNSKATENLSTISVDNPVDWAFFYCDPRYVLL